MTTNELLSALEAMAGLKPDWDSYGADPPSRQAIDAAKSALLGAEETIPVNHVCPSASNGVALCWFSNNPEKRHADVEFFNNGDVIACTYGETDEPMVWEVKSLPETFSTIKAWLNVSR